MTVHRTPLERRARHLAACLLARPLAACATVVCLASPLVAQQRDSTRAPARPGAAPADTARRDSAGASARSRPAAAARARRAAPTALPDSLTRPPISARRAFFYSFLVPGLGQHRLRRAKASALFSSVELGAWFMVLKSQNDLRIALDRPDSIITGYGPPPAGSTDSVPIKVPDRLAVRARARRLHVEDWIAVIIFNHLLAGADAFVAAQLWDLPAQVSLRPAPGGPGVAVNASIAW